MHRAGALCCVLSCWVHFQWSEGQEVQGESQTKHTYPCSTDPSQTQTQCLSSYVIILSFSSLCQSLVEMFQFKNCTIRPPTPNSPFIHRPRAVSPGKAFGWKIPKPLWCGEFTRWSLHHNTQTVLLKGHVKGNIHTSGQKALLLSCPSVASPTGTIRQDAHITTANHVPLRVIVSDWMSSSHISRMWILGRSKAKDQWVMVRQPWQDENEQPAFL